MVSTMRLEPFGGINNWDWAKASKIKSGLRAPRRPKVYSAENKRKSVGRNFKESEDLTSKGSKMGEMSVLESEKLGVSILGRRFSDSIQSVPIKKRRFLQLQSPSPPCSPSHLPEVSGCSLACEGGGMTQHLNVEHHGSNSDKRMDSDLERSVTNENNKWDMHDIPCEGADFSGISILAAAACNSGVGGDIISSEASVTREQDEEASHLISEKAESHGVLGDKLVDQQLNNAKVFDGKAVIPFATMATSALSNEEEDINTNRESGILEEPLSNSHSMLVNSSETVGKRSSSRDGRFLWDLNKTIDVWEDSDAGFFDSEDPSVDGSSKDAVKPDGFNVCPVQLGPGIVKSPSKLAGDVYLDDKLKGSGLCKEFDDPAERDLSFNRSSVTDHDTESHSLTVVCIGDSAQSKHYVSEDVIKVADERHASNNSRNDHSNETIGSEGRDNIDCLKSNSESASGTSHSHQVFTGNTCTISAAHQSEAHPTVNHPARERVVQDSEHVSAVDVFNKLSVDTTVIDSINEPTTCTGDPYEQPGDTPEIDSKTVATPCTGDPHMPTPLISDSVTNEILGIQVDKSIVEKSSMGADSCNVVEQSEPVGNPSSGLCQSEQIVRIMSQDPSILVEMHSGSNCASKEAGDPTELKMQVQKISAVVDVNLNPKVDHILDESKDYVYDSANAVVAMVDGQLDAVDPCAPCSYSKDASTVVKSFEENGSENRFDCDSHSIPSQNDIERQIELEKVDLHGDDDSQYEDGEFRESTLLDWQLDGDEEGEAEHVDYGSDNDKDTEVFGASPDYHAFVGHPSLGGTGYKSEKPLEDGSLHFVGGQTSKDITGITSKQYQNSNIETEKRTGLMEKVGRGHSRRRDGSEKSSRDAKDALQVAVNSKIIFGSELYSENSDGTKELSHAASLKMKSSGWDCLPDCSKATRDLVVDIRSDGTKTDQTGALDRYVESRRRGAESTMRTELSSRIERPKPSEISRRQDEAYFWRKRVNPDESSVSVERNGGHATSSRRDGSALRRHGRRSRVGDTWGGSSGQWGLARHKSPGNYDSCGFSQSNLKNVADVATVKVESNGLVVAPDGTVVEPSDMEHVGQAPRQNVNPSFQAPQRSLSKRVSPNRRDESSDFDSSLDFGHVRETSTDRRANVSHGRPGRYDHRVVSTGHRERYAGPVAGESIDSSLPIRHTFSRRDRNYSPQRGPIHISKTQTESRSRSRTRSPHVWTSPRRKGDNGMNCLRRWSRSPPNFRLAARGDRMRSPHHRQGYLDRMPDFVPSSRSHVSPPHTSRWIDQRKDLEDQFGEHEYRRSSGRSPPTRLFSRSHRFDMDNGRIKADEYHRLSNPGRFREFAVTRRPRFDERNDRRGPGNRYEIFASPSGQYDIVDDMKHLTYDIDDGFRLNGSRYKGGPDFDGRGSPRVFDRAIEGQIDSPPCRPRDDGGHFRYGSGVRQSSSFKSFRIRECDEDMTQRRRLS